MCSWTRSLILLAILGVGGNVAFASGPPEWSRPFGEKPGSRAPQESTGRARIGSRLKRLIASYEPATQIVHGRGAGPPQRVPVILEPRRRQFGATAAEAIDIDQVQTLGGQVDAVSRSLMRVLVPVEEITRLAEHDDVALIRAPAIARPTDFGSIVTESVTLTGATSLIDSGANGAGVRVAVIDLGFVGLNNAIAAGELPADTVTVDFTGEGVDRGTDHGMAVAEHVVDMAPGASLYLIRVRDQVDLQNAADYLRQHQIQIANHSVAWMAESYYDDTGTINDIVNESHDVDGVLWTVALGNYGRSHWRGSWNDSDGDSVLDITSSDEYIAINPADDVSLVWLYLNWNQYDQAVTDLDLYVLRHEPDGSLTVVARSEGLQGSGQTPKEVLSFSPQTDESYSTSVVHRGGPLPAGLDITLFADNANLEHAVIASSIPDPCGAHGAIGVGAVNQLSWRDFEPEIEYFSSQGPTNDGRLKPDIVAPDGTSSWSRGRRQSYGTSISSPTVAGAAALLLSEDMSRSIDEVRQRLASMALDIGESGPDPVFGAGLLQLTPAANTMPVARADVATVDEEESVVVAVLSNDFDPDRDPLTLIGAGATSNARLVINADRTITYDPHYNFYGTDTFRYRISDNRGGVASGEVEVTVRPLPDPPRPTPDSAVTSMGTPVVIDVLANDVDPDGEPLTVVQASWPSHGRAWNNGDGTVTYTPDAAYTGVDGFTYTITDGSLYAAGTARIQIVGSNAPPVAKDDASATDEDTAVVVDVRSNDTDADGDPLTVVEIEPPPERSGQRR